MLVDTSVWVDHLRRGHAALEARLVKGDVECHPFIIGELACGNLRNRVEILSLLRSLPSVTVVEHDEVLAWVDSMGLMGRGLGWVDVHLLASTALQHTTLWTSDRRLAAQARALGILFV